MADQQVQQLDLEMVGLVMPKYEQSMTLREKFEAFHELNPHVYKAIVRELRRLKWLGRRPSMAKAFENLRDDTRTRGDEWRLNNSYRAFYSRMVREREPDLAADIEVRVQPSEASCG